MNPPTRSEILFEHYLLEQGIQPHKIETKDNKQPDYRIEFDGRSVFFEVKEFGRPKPFPSGGFCPLPYIQRKINKARKFDQYRESCCALVLYNDQSIVVQLNAYSMLSVLFGEYYRVQPGGAVSLFGSAELHADKHTTLSAVITLRPVMLDPITIDVGEAWYDRQLKLGRPLPDDEIREIYNNALQQRRATEERIRGLRATVFKNPQTPPARQLPKGLFRGLFDEWWESRGDSFECTFRGARLSKLWDVLPEYALAPVSGIH